MTTEEINSFLYYDAMFLMLGCNTPITQKQELPPIAPTLEQMPKRSWRDTLQNKSHDLTT